MKKEKGQNVLIQALGYSDNLKIMTFFLEMPFHSFTKKQIAKFNETNNKSTFKIVNFFHGKGYLTLKDGKYQLNLDSPMVKAFEECMSQVGDVIFEQKFGKKEQVMEE